MLLKIARLQLRNDTWADDVVSETMIAALEGEPASLGRIFMMREWMELETEQVCKELSITSTHAFVRLYRARGRLHWRSGPCRGHVVEQLELMRQAIKRLGAAAD